MYGIYHFENLSSLLLLLLMMFSSLREAMSCINSMKDACTAAAGKVIDSAMIPNIEALELCYHEHLFEGTVLSYAKLC